MRPRDTATPSPQVEEQETPQQFAQRLYGTAFKLSEDERSLTVECCAETCARVLKMPFIPKRTPQSVQAAVNRQGWKLKNNGRFAFCSGCGADLPRILPKKWLPGQLVPKKPGPEDLPAQEGHKQRPSPAARKKALQALDILRENFDGAHGHYLGGYSDERISQEVGLSIEAVVGLREEFFGQLKGPPPELQEVILKVQEMEKMAASNRAELQSLRELLESCENDHQKIEAELRALSKKLK